MHFCLNPHDLLYLLSDSNKKYLQKGFSAAFQLRNLFLCLYVLLFLTQGHPTWESIIDTDTMQTVQKFYYCKYF